MRKPFKYLYKRTHDSFFDCGNDVSMKKVEKINKIKVTRRFQEWKAKEGNEMNLFGQKKQFHQNRKRNQQKTKETL